MSKSPAFQFYANDFLGSAKVGMMSAEEIGAYLLLLLLDWQEGGFVFDQKRLAKWCRLSTAKFGEAWSSILRDCFVMANGRWWNPRLAAERAKQEEWRQKSAKGAASTNRRRWNGDNGGDPPGDHQTVATPIATPIANDVATPIASESANGRTPFPFPSPTPVSTSTQSASARARESADVARLLDGIPDLTARESWAAEIAVASEGLHGPALTEAQVDRACRDYVGNGHLESLSLRHFRAFLRNAANPDRPRSLEETPGKRPESLARLSKQEVGRKSLAEWVAEHEAANAPGDPNGE